MLSKLRSNLPVLSVAAAALTIGLMAPAIGHGVQHALFAHNADKLDNKDSKSFLRSKSIVTTHGGLGWVEYNDPPTTVDRFISGIQVEGPGSMVIPLDAATGYLSAKFGLKNVQVCFWTSGDHMITNIDIFRSDVGTADEIFDDPTDRTTLNTNITCPTLAVNRSVSKGANLRVSVAGTTGGVRLEAVRATWTQGANVTRNVTAKSASRSDNG